ncbi:MAG: amidohydrolase [bacterium]|nr:amidohydrolase [bacterium]
MERKIDLKIALVQQEIAWENLPANLEYYAQIIHQIPTQTDIIVLPEMFSTGFSMKPEKFEEESLQTAMEYMKSWSASCGTVVCGSVMVKENNQYFNRFCWFEPNGNSAFYNKAHLFRMGEEQLHYSKGKDQVIINYKGWKIAPFICYDLRFPVWIRRTKKYDYDLLIFVANWPERRSEHWKVLTLARAIENQSYLVAVNRIGFDGNGVNHSGNSRAINPLGQIILDAKDAVSVNIVNINYDELMQYRESFPVGLDTDNFEIVQ